MGWSVYAGTPDLFKTEHLVIFSRIPTKQEYVLSDKNGKTVPEKVGLKAVQREGLEYEFTLLFELAANQKASVSKDRTGLFTGQPDELLSTETGKRIAEWCASGSPITQKDVEEKIEAASTVDELVSLYHAHPAFQQQLHAKFESRKKVIKKQQLAAASTAEPVN
jgi:hypothetical protein